MFKLKWEEHRQTEPHKTEMTPRDDGSLQRLARAIQPESLARIFVYTYA